MSNNNKTNIPRISEEERRIQMMRAITQERKTIAQGVIFNTCHANPVMSEEDAVKLVDTAFIIADAYLKKCYTTENETEE